MKTKKLSRLLSILLSLALIAGVMPPAWADEGEPPVDPPAPATVMVTSIQIDGPGTVDEGSSVTLSAVVTTDPENDAVTYSWSVEGAGAHIEGNANGRSVSIVGDTGGSSVTVSVRAESSTGHAMTQGATLLVNPVLPPEIPVTGITLSQSSLELLEGATATLTATLTPSDATPKEVKWNSSNPAVAAVDQNGGITAGRPDVASITATVEGTGLTASCTVTVKPAVVPVERVVLSGPATVTAGQNIQLTAKVEPANATSQTITWSASNGNASVSNSGVVTGIKAGNVTIIATSDNGKAAAWEITVAAATVPATGVAVTPKSSSIPVNGTIQLTATVSPGSATDKTVTWSATPSGIVSVSGSGLVTGLKAGTANITAQTRDGNWTDTCTVVVTNSPTLSNTSLSLEITKSASLTVNNLPAGATVAWATSNAAIARINSASGASIAVTGVSKGGPISITATVRQNNAIIATLTCSVTVTALSIPNITYTVTADKTVTFDRNDFNNVCTRVTGYTLDSVKFDKNSNHGLLYFNYVSNGDSDGKISTTSSYSYAGSTRSISNITFLPDVDYTGDATFGYTAYDIKGNTYVGTVVITVKAPSGDIKYSTGRNEPVTFDAGDFQDVCRRLVGGTLEYVRFDTPNSNRGTLYYGYENGSSEKKVSSNTEYYYNDTPYLEEITFVPYQNYTGTVSIHFTGRNTRREAFTGTVEITVTRTGTNIEYKTDENEDVDFRSSDFNSYCKDVTGSNLDWIRFTPPSSSKGTLYYKYETSKEDETTAKTTYYRSSTPSVDDLTFVPYKGFTGTVSIDFKGAGTNQQEFSGTVRIKVGAAGSSDGDVSYTAAAGSNITFKASDFNTYCKADTGYNLSWVKFTLPSSSTGTLYYEYESKNNSGKKVSSSTQYQRNSNPYLDRVTYVPAKSAAGEVSIKFSGENTNGDRFSGTVSITYTAVKDPSVIRYSTNANAVTFRASDFESACNTRGGAALTSVQFALPNPDAGILYYNYTGPTNYGGLVMPGVDYGIRSSTILLSYVAFVPKAGFNGTVTITYTGTDANNATYTGYVEVTVSQPVAPAGSRFTDMSNAAWASAAVEYLYVNGITTGVTATTFNPSGKITRGDFILMLFRAFHLTGNTSDNFKDVPANSYYANAIAVAKALGIAQGSDGGSFNPTAALTREDAMVFIQRTMAKTGRNIADASATYLNQFPDGKNVSSYAQGAVASLVQLGVIKGDNTGKLNPKGSLTRAEMAVILQRVLTL